MAKVDGPRSYTSAVAFKNLQDADAALLAAAKIGEKTKLRAAAIAFGRAESHARAAKAREVVSSVVEALDTSKK